MSQAVVPSTWNAGPRDANGQPGPYEQAIANLLGQLVDSPHNRVFSVRPAAVFREVAEHPVEASELGEVQITILTAFPGKGRLKAQEEALRQLRRENEILRQERDILKKAVAIFSEDPNRYSDS